MGVLSCLQFVSSSYAGGTTSVVYWSQLLATDPEVPGSIPDTTRFSEK
jgi:hypothetical protein